MWLRISQSRRVDEVADRPPMALQGLAAPARVTVQSTLCSETRARAPPR